MSVFEFKDLKTWFYTDDGIVKAVNGVSFEIPEGKTVCVVGESGCGKSVTALSMMHLVQTPPGRIVGGQILMDGVDLLKLSDREMQQINGKQIGMIFQEPMTSLNPVFTVGHQIMENLITHTGASETEARKKAVEMIKLVNIPRAEEIVDCYPHELSGGMRQRVMIAMALSCNPKLLIADEPTTALDVTIQAQIMRLLRELQREFSMAVVLITHDIGLVAQMADRVLVMYAGQIVEQAEVHDLFHHPAHPYTRMLLRTVPSTKDSADRVLESIPGTVPENYYEITGCRFADRCPRAGEACSRPQPFCAVSENHLARCWRCRSHPAQGEDGKTYG